jgi:hypothetical protein
MREQAGKIGFPAILFSTCVMLCLGLAIYIEKNILRQKKNYENSNFFHHEKM